MKREFYLHSKSYKTILFIVAILLFCMCACSKTGEATNAADYEAQLAEKDEVISQLQAQVDILTAENAALSDEIEQLQSQGNITSSSEPEASASNDTWLSSLPDGIDAKLQIVDDYSGYIVYTNNTGDDVFLNTNTICFDEFGILDIFGNSNQLLRDGEKCVDILSTRDPIVSFQVDCSIDDVRQSTKDDYNALTVNTSRNSNDSVTVSVSSTSSDQIAFFVSIFFTDENGDILGYNQSSPQFIYDMGGTFEAPGFEYADYFIVLSV